MVTGVNGGGKTTLFDAITSLLNPYSGQARLGQVDGTKGGGARDLASYCFGKFLSQDGKARQVADQEEGVPGYNRQSGTTILLASFFNAANPARCVTLARLIWYNNLQLRDEQGFVVAESDLTIQGPFESSLLDEEGCTYRSLSELKKALDKKPGFYGARVMSRAGEYMAAIEDTLGIHLRDAKFFNRAMNLKSIPDTCNFISKDVLDLDDEDKDILKQVIDLTANSERIATQITACEEKIRISKNVIAALQGAQHELSKREELEYQQKEAKVFADWNQKRTAIERLGKAEASVVALQSQLAENQRRSVELSLELERLNVLLANDDDEKRLLLLRQQISGVEAQIRTLAERRNEYARLCRNLWSRLPSTKEELQSQKTSFQNEIPQLDEQLVRLEENADELKASRKQCDEEVVQLKSELEFLENNACRIDSKLYGVKLKAIEVLGIPPEQLAFVGELLNFKTPAMRTKYEVPVESALSAIGRNLLVHPDVHERFVLWLEDQALKTNISCRRISPEELEPSGRFTAKADSILACLNVLPEDKTCFHHYLVALLFRDFDYRICDARKLANTSARVVSQQGIVQSSAKSFRKLGAGFPRQIGWDNKDEQKAIRAKIAEKTAESQNQVTLIAELRQRMDSIRMRKVAISALLVCSEEFLELPQVEEHLNDLQRECANLLANNANTASIRAQRDIVKQQSNEATEQTGTLKAKLEYQKALQTQLKEAIDASSKRLQATIRNQGLTAFEGSEAVLDDAMNSFVTRLGGVALEEFEEKVVQGILTAESRCQQSYRSAQEQITAFHNAFPGTTDLLKQAPEDRQGCNRALSAWSDKLQKLEKTGLPAAREDWNAFVLGQLMITMSQTLQLFDDRKAKILRDIRRINAILRQVPFENFSSQEPAALAANDAGASSDVSVLKVIHEYHGDSRIKDFERHMLRVRSILSTRRIVEDQAGEEARATLQVLKDFTEFLATNNNEEFVSDPRNHFSYKVANVRRGETEAQDENLEYFRGSNNSDGKSGAQTALLAFALIGASALVRYGIGESMRSNKTPRLLVLDEFTSNLDNRKAEAVLRLLERMGLQVITAFPINSVEIVEGLVSQICFIYKQDRARSFAQSFGIRKDCSLALQLRLAMANAESSMPSSWVGENREDPMMLVDREVLSAGSSEVVSDSGNAENTPSTELRAEEVPITESTFSDGDGLLEPKVMVRSTPVHWDDESVKRKSLMETMVEASGILRPAISLPIPQPSAAETPAEVLPALQKTLEGDVP